MDLKDLIGPNTVGVVGLLFIAVWAFVFKKVVPSWSYTDMLAEKDAQIAKIEKDRDEFKVIAMRSLEITERSQVARKKAFEQP